MNIRIGPLTGMVERRSLWLRLFGKGFSLSHDKTYPPLFSERSGYVKTWTLLGWRFRWLFD